MAQDVRFEWAKKNGGTGDERGNDLFINSGGDIITTGSFTGTADFDPGNEKFILTSFGDEDIFIQKLDSDGNFIWALKIGGKDVDRGMGITADNSGNIYVTGSFTGSVDFDPGEGVFELSAGNSSYSYILKLNSSGEFNWAKKLDLIGANSIVIDEYGDVYTVGYSVNKVSPEGNIEWSFDPNEYQSTMEGFAIVAKSDHLYITGRFEGAVDFDPGVDKHMLTSRDGMGGGLWVGSDVFVLKLDYSGNLEWAKQMGGSNRDTGYGITVDNYDNVFLTGVFYDKGDFNPGLDIFELENTGATDIFIVRLDHAGNFGWAKKIGSTSYDNGNSITVDTGSNLYITGDFNEIVDFDPGDGVFTLDGNNNGNHNQYILALNGNGDFVWAKKGGSGSQSYVAGNSIVFDGNDKIYTTGTFYENAEFDFDNASSTLISSGQGDIFISKLSVSGMPDILPTEIEPTILSLNSNSNIDETSIYPNPAIDVVYFDSWELINKVKIISMEGKVISEVTLTKNNLNISQLRDGNYFLKLTTVTGKVATHRLVVCGPN